MDYQVDVAALSHDDKCRYWDDEEFCDCGAVEGEKLRQCEAHLAEVEQEREEIIRNWRGAIAELAEATRAKCKAIDHAGSAEQDRDRLAAGVEQVKDVGAAFKQANEEMHEMIMQIRRRFKAWDTPYSPVGQDIVDCIIRHADEELTAAQEENKRLAGEIAAANGLIQTLTRENERLEEANEAFNDARKASDQLIASLSQQLTAAQQSAQERDILGQAIGEAVVEAGISEEVAMTGPELLLMLDGLVMQAQSAQEQYRKGMERAVEIIGNFAICQANAWARGALYRAAGAIRTELSDGEGK